MNCVDFLNYDVLALRLASKLFSHLLLARYLVLDFYAVSDYNRRFRIFLSR